MANKMSNFPNNSIKSLDGKQYTSDTTACLMELADKRIPNTTAELKQRIHDYFEFCIDNSRRPGIEGLCLALGTSRQAFWNWCNGKTQSRDDEWVNTCIMARQTILTFIECAQMDGQITPISAIWLQKNWGGYTDSQQIEIVQNEDKGVRNYESLPMFDTEKGKTGRVIDF